MRAERASFVEIYAGDWLPYESPLVSGRDAETFDFRVFNLLLEKKNVCESTSLDCRGTKIVDRGSGEEDDISGGAMLPLVSPLHGPEGARNSPRNQTHDYPHRHASAAARSTFRLGEVQPRLLLCRT